MVLERVTGVGVAHGASHGLPLKHFPVAGVQGVKQLVSLLLEVLGIAPVGPAKINVMRGTGQSKAQVFDIEQSKAKIEPSKRKLNRHSKN